MSRGDLLLHATGDQLAQHRVQPAGDLIARPGQVPVPLGPHLQDRAVVIGPHLAAAVPAQRGDRRPTGRRSGRSCSCPRPPAAVPGRRAWAARPGPAPGRDQLLGHQVAQARGALHRPGALRPRHRPFDQLLSLPGRRADPQPAQLPLIRATGRRRVRALVRVHPDHHCRHGTALSHACGQRKRPRQACLITDHWGCSRLFRTTPRQESDRPAPRSKARPPTRPAGGSGARPIRPSERYGSQPQRLPQISGGSVAHAGGLPGSGPRSGCLQALARPWPHRRDAGLAFLVRQLKPGHLGNCRPPTRPRASVAGRTSSSRAASRSPRWWPGKSPRPSFAVSAGFVRPGRRRWRCQPVTVTAQELLLKSARERMDIISAYREAGTYRGRPRSAARPRRPSGG